MKGNFKKFDNILEKLENIGTTTIRNLINSGDELIMQTEEDDFNSRFLAERSGTAQIIDDLNMDPHSDVEDYAKPETNQ